jgi:zinc protease
MPQSPPTTVHHLANGLTVLIRKDSTFPVASYQYWVETGSMHEGRHIGSGLSHLIEHMVFKGTRSFSGQDLNCKVQELGGH